MGEVEDKIDPHARVYFVYILAFKAKQMADKFNRPKNWKSLPFSQSFLELFELSNLLAFSSLKKLEYT